MAARRAQSQMDVDDEEEDEESPPEREAKRRSRFGGESHGGGGAGNQSRADEPRSNKRSKDKPNATTTTAATAAATVPAPAVMSAGVRPGAAAAASSERIVPVAQGMMTAARFDAGQAATGQGSTKALPKLSHTYTTSTPRERGAGQTDQPPAQAQAFNTATAVTSSSVKPGAPASKPGPAAPVKTPTASTAATPASIAAAAGGFAPSRPAPAPAPALRSFTGPVGIEEDDDIDYDDGDDLSDGEAEERQVPPEVYAEPGMLAAARQGLPRTSQNDVSKEQDWRPYPLVNARAVPARVDARGQKRRSEMDDETFPESDQAANQRAKRNRPERGNVPDVRPRVESTPKQQPSAAATVYPGSAAAATAAVAAAVAVPRGRPAATTTTSPAVGVRQPPSTAATNSSIPLPAASTADTTTNANRDGGMNFLGPKKGPGQDSKGSNTALARARMGLPPTTAPPAGNTTITTTPASASPSRFPPPSYESVSKTPAAFPIAATTPAPAAPASSAPASRLRATTPPDEDASNHVASYIARLDPLKVTDHGRPVTTPIVLRDGVTVLGRGQGLPGDDPRLSRVHAEITFDAKTGAMSISVKGINGVVHSQFTGGQRQAVGVGERRDLTHGDELSFGSQRYGLHCEELPKAPEGALVATGTHATTKSTAAPLGAAATGAMAEAEDLFPYPEPMANYVGAPPPASEPAATLAAVPPAVPTFALAPFVLPTAEVTPAPAAATTTTANANATTTEPAAPLLSPYAAYPSPYAAYPPMYGMFPYAGAYPGGFAVHYHFYGAAPWLDPHAQPMPPMPAMQTVPMVQAAPEQDARHGAPHVDHHCGCTCHMPPLVEDTGVNEAPSEEGVRKDDPATTATEAALAKTSTAAVTPFPAAATPFPTTGTAVTPFPAAATPITTTCPAVTASPAAATPVTTTGTAVTASPAAATPFTTTGTAVTASLAAATSLATTGTACRTCARIHVPTERCADTLYSGQGDCLLPGQALISPSGMYRLVYREDGNLVLTDVIHNVFFSTGTSGCTTGRVELTTAGTLNIVDAASEVVWTVAASRKAVGPYHLTVQDDRNVEFRDSQGDIVWQSHSRKGRTAALDRLLAGESLHPGESLHSVDGSYCLLYERDGRLAMYSHRDHSTVWSLSFGQSYAVGRVTLQPHGELAVTDVRGETIWESRRKSPGRAPYELILERSGALQIVDGEGSVLWTSQIGGKI